MKDVLFSVFQDQRFMDLTLYQFGYEKCLPLHSFGPCVRNHYLFHYIISGKGVLHSDDPEHHTITHHLSMDMGFLIEPGVANFYIADKDEPWEYIWVEFGGLRAKEFLAAAGLSYETPVYNPDTPTHGHALQEEMFQILNGSSTSPLARIGHLYLFMDKLISSSTAHKQLQGGKLSEFYARETISFIEQYYNQNITVLDMANRCNLDRSYFGKVFKETVGQSPQEFLIQYRMSKAAEALSLTDRPIGEIGVSVGYPNQLHFSRAFKNAYGVAPREYRQMNRLKDVKK
ncbi:MAG: AraC family transcriptional regulator [Eubacteriales bacterium]|nr:AraC family transcriptional regulator [Eubacteriales bacterium]